MFLTVRMTRFLKYYIDVLHMVYTWKNHLCSTKVIHNVVFCGKYINLPSMSMENVWNTLVTWEGFSDNHVNQKTRFSDRLLIDLYGSESSEN